MTLVFTLIDDWRAEAADLDVYALTCLFQASDSCSEKFEMGFPSFILKSFHVCGAI